MNIVILSLVVLAVVIGLLYGVGMVLRGIYDLDAKTERESRARGYRVYNAAPGALIPEWKRVDE